MYVKVCALYMYTLNVLKLLMMHLQVEAVVVEKDFMTVSGNVGK